MNDRPLVVRDPEDAKMSDVAQIAAIALGGDHGIVNRHVTSGLALECTQLGPPRTFATLRLDGATAASMRLADLVLTIGDDRGRVIVFDVVRGLVRRDFRTS